MSESNDGWLELEYSKNMERDLFLILMKGNSLFLKLYKIFKKRKYALFIGEILYHQAEMIKKTFEDHNKDYDDILRDRFTEIINVIKKNNLCEILENMQVKNVRGFDIFNATSFPCFGDNLIAINTGVFFLAHTLVKSIGVLLVKKVSGENIHPRFIFNNNFFINEFIKTSIAIICEDHYKAIMKMGIIIPDDDPLLSGIELFCIAHEYSHLLFRKLDYNYQSLNFNKYFNSEITELISTNEEIAADAFSIIILKHFEIDPRKLSMFSYAPQFLFKVLSNYDEIKKPYQSGSHPTNFERYNYIKKMINEYESNIYDDEIDKVWNKCKIKIQKKCYKCFNEIISIWNEIQSIIIEESEKNKNMLSNITSISDSSKEQ